MPPIRRREVFRPSRATADRAACGRGAPQESAGAGGAPHLRPHSGSALTECAGRGMPPPGALRHGRVRLRRHSPRPDLQTHTTTRLCSKEQMSNSVTHYNATPLRRGEVNADLV